ncbi:helix-turn-helix transcriptional regulator [Streptomyces rishiriensis]|uniref:DNA-binding NarL/FixJ family response regulator/chloramphenicol 3-O-phosphotransferase n=1 Tax=Streptomyces rishiriensis TaxID=68264 RepID=A0ABU0NT40_STRRH|nr:AAA family ATPase [Streptomyces rishiriensis]MDQ0582333.1 DNA-binding NarL/FixJ family response regulator/chloramphenicol 3-O-phosphotransferase [Streptomyces rishiriensis]
MTGPLREREDAQALLTAEAERARAGQGRLVLLRGATGTGRSAVLEAAAAQATHLGLRVLRARCSPDDTTLAFSSVLHLLGSVPEFADVGPGGDDRGSAARLWRLLRSYADETPLMVAVDDVHLADEASRRWFVEAARRIDRLPVLLVVTERSQYDIGPRPAGLTHALSPSEVRTHTLAPLTDNASADLVRAAFPTASDRWTADCVRAGAGSPLLLHALLDDLGGAPPPTAVPRTCAALYPGSYPAAVSWWLDSAGPATAEVARTLAALEQAEQRREHAERAERTARRERAERAERSEWPESTAARNTVPGPGPGPGPGPVPVPDPAPVSVPGPVPGPGPARAPAPDQDTDPAGLSASDATSGTVHEALPATDAATDTLAALVADASGADPARVCGWFTAMTRLGVLRPDPAGRPRYAHPLLRDAVLGGWSTARRQDAHRALAQAMLRRGDHLDAVARQLLGSAPAGLPWALRVLRDAATVAARDARPGDAVRYLRRALQEPLPDDLRQRLLTELGSLEYASADTPAGIPRLAEALDLPAEPRDQVRTAIALGTALAGRGEVRTAVEVLRRLEARLAAHPDLARTLQTASALLSDQDQTVRREAYRWLTDTAERSPELVGASGQALLVRYAATAGDLPAREAMRRMRTLLTEPADPLAEPFLLGTAAAVAQWADELDEAERLVERGLAGQHPSLLHPMEKALLDTRWDITAARGDYGTLLAALPGAARARSTGGGPVNADAHTLLALVETGRTPEARRLADTFDLRATPDSWELNRFLYARGVLRFTEGDVAGALHDFLECGRRQSARAVLSPVVTPWRTAAAECRLALGNPQEALALATEELRLARVWNTPRTTGRALRVLGRATRGRRGLELGAEAVAVLRDSPAEAELVASLLAHGRQLTDAGERGRGRDHLREGAERAERLGSVRLLTHAEQALRTAGGRRTTPAHTGSGALTGSERRIAELAAEGRTNTEIAELLHVARRTVETHLTSTYRKLGIRRRGELRGVLVD